MLRRVAIVVLYPLLLGLASCCQVSREPRVSLGLEREPSRVSVNWCFTNYLAQPIWIPLREGKGLGCEWNGQLHPRGFLTPDGDLVFVLGEFSGHLKGGLRRTDRRIPGERYFEYRCVPPGGRVRGRISLPIPYTIQWEFLSEEWGCVKLSNPYEHPVDPRHEPPDVRRRKVIVKEALGLFVVVQYELDEQQRQPVVAWQKSLRRRAMGAAMLDGIRYYYYPRGVVTRYAASERVQVTVPFSQPRTIWPEPDETGWTWDGNGFGAQRPK